VLNDAGGDGGGFYIADGAVSFYGSSFENNQAVSGAGGFNSSGEVFLSDAEFHSNDASEHGGGIYNGYHAGIYRSTFSANTADGDGGGVYHAEGSSSDTIINSTFSANQADRGGGVFSASRLNITNDTFSDNTAAEGGAVFGENNTELRNTILAGSPGDSICDGPATHPRDMGNNIDSGNTCSFGSTFGSMSNTDPLLGALQENGGLTKNKMILNGSPAVDGVIYNPPNNCPDGDQRGYPRPYGVRRDIGAVERYYRVFAPLTVSR
jgi:hypothetical protein